MNRHFFRLLPKTKFQWIRLFILAAIALFIFTIQFGLPLLGTALYNPHVGDVVFQSLPRVDLVKAIEGATHSPYSHCGVVLKKDGEWFVIEALGEVKLTPLFTWVRQGRFGRFTAFRLKSEYRNMIPRFIEELKGYLCLPYDFRYRMDDERIYCSELVYKGFKRAAGEELGKLTKLGNLDWKPYAEIIKSIEGGLPPLDRVMITPRNLSEALQLEKVFSFGL